MFARSKVALTFFCLVVALGLATVSEANSLVTPARGHVELSRMIKKRADVSGFPLLPVFGAESDPTSTASTGSSTATSGSATGTSSSATSSVTASSAASTSSSATSSSATSASSASTSSDTSSSAASSSATSTSSSTTSSAPSSTSSATPTSTSEADISFTSAPGPDTDTQTSSARSTSTNFVTVTDSSAQASATSGASTTGAVKTDNSHITRTTIIVIAVIASTVGGIALAWTIFRKWKLRPSSNFDDRMQPIDWQPTAPEDAGIIPSHRRAGSNESHGSFKSSSHGHGAAGLQPLPEHDFTAGASLAPVGGYADLQRGPSPQPSMAELSRGPSMNRPGYDYGMPMQHQGMGGGAYDYGHGARY
ncbi:uncharacterized protein TRAVEDRAFT_41678 [Trametes versicolor FP-101664 SS1]|uniref:uncharacterized protein n=1 Tax=Trametes versicolor (strain FP-101664) TaxID=717944 RepID=UPI00046223EE|nr:uncharacterized protein TRAVEDRAFT_41678 [Trametes versicolor FP-101664 SS1]EIW64258.1 hypothetical protein TRAVEDRAFT_41678 [Trametes versicolor FP-101664 SS1]